MVLGPILFLVFINISPEYVKSSSVSLFADDCKKLCQSIDCDSDAQRLQTDLGQLQNWEANRILLTQMPTAESDKP